MAVSRTESTVYQQTSTQPVASIRTSEQILLLPWASSIGYFDAPAQTNSALPWNWAPLTAFPEDIPVSETASKITVAQHSASAPTTPSESAPITGTIHHTVSTVAIAGIVVAGVIAAISLVIGCVCLRRHYATLKARHPLLPHLSQKPGSTKKGATQVVEPFTLPPTTSISTARCNSKSRFEQHRNGPRIQAPDHTHTFNMGQRSPINNALYSGLPQASLIREGDTFDRRAEAHHIGQLTAQVATLQHQVLRIQMQNNLPHYAYSPSIVGPPDYVSASVTGNVLAELL